MLRCGWTSLFLVAKLVCSSYLSLYDSLFDVLTYNVSEIRIYDNVLLPIYQFFDTSFHPGFQTNRIFVARTVAVGPNRKLFLESINPRLFRLGNFIQIFDIMNIKCFWCTTCQLSSKNRPVIE